MDSRDREIIKQLSENARTSYSELGRSLGITEAAVRKRIQKLEREGIIRGYKAKIDHRKTGKVVSLTGLDVAPERLAWVSSRVKEFPEVEEAWFSSGDHTIMLMVSCESTGVMEKVHKQLSRLNGVMRVCPAILSERIK